MKGLRVTFRVLLLRAAPRHAVITYVHGEGDVVGRCSHWSEGGDPAIGAKTSEKARAREKTGRLLQEEASRSTARQKTLQTEKTMRSHRASLSGVWAGEQRMQPRYWGSLCG